MTSNVKQNVITVSVLTLTYSIAVGIMGILVSVF